MLVTESFSTAPYPGLRPFETEESDIFFGREKQTDELLARLQRTRFLAVLGPSGCGKSSLVRAGLIAALETGFMAAAGSRWRVVQMRPGERPIGRLADELMAPDVLGRDRADQPDARLFVEAALRRGPRGLIELVAESGLCRNANLLVLVDQFEELFRFRSIGDPDEADAFVSLLLESAAQTTLPIYVVMTMRSDFIGDCSLFRNLPEAINESAYLIPRLTREQCAAAITGPARVFGGELEPSLVNRLLNDFGPDPDQLPLLQHALMRMWQRRSDPAQEHSRRIVLTVADYELLGALPRALSDHADEVLAELPAGLQQLAKTIFQRLTERGTGKRDTRAPARIGDIAVVAGAPIEDVIRVVAAFRQPGRSFLTPRDGPLTADTLVDIGHESLIRQWRKLAGWVNEEAESASTYLRLRDTARLWNAGEAALWGNPDLARAVQWRERTHPNANWAVRYGTADDFEIAMRFLQASERHQQALEAAAEREHERALHRARRLALVFGTVAALLIAAILVNQYLFAWESAEFYKTFVKVRGVPTGIGRLTLEQVRHRSSSLKIVRRGRLGPVERMEAVNSRGGPTTHHAIATYLSDDLDARKEVRWEFEYDAHGHLADEVAFDRYGKRLWAAIYSEPDNSVPARLVHFVDADGYPRQTKDVGAGYVRIEYLPDGHESAVTYRNPLGEPRSGPNKAFGQRYKYDAEGRLIELVSLGPEGKPMIDDAGNAGLRITPDDSGDNVEYVATDVTGAVTIVKDGWSRQRIRYDRYGNATEIAYFDEEGRPTLHKDGFHRSTSTVDDRGNVKEVWYWDVNARATLVDGCHGLRHSYDDRDNVVRTTCISISGTPSPDVRGVTASALRYDNRNNLLEVAYVDASDRPVYGDAGYSRIAYGYDARGNRIETAYFGLKGEPVATKDGYWQLTSKYDDHGNEVSRAYFGTDRRPVVIAAPGGARYAALRRRFDESGNIVHEAYFDTNGKPMIARNGYAAWQATYDLSGNKIETVYFGLRDERVVSADGYAGWRQQYDELGRRTRVEFFGLRGNLIASKEGVAGWTTKYDGQSNEVERRYFGDDGKPVTHNDGYAWWQAGYDRRGNRIELAFFDVYDAPALAPWDRSKPSARGYAHRTRVYDPRNRMIEEAYYGKDNEPVLHPDGWAHLVNRYDLRNTTPVETTYFGIRNEPVLLPDGYHAVERRLDDYGRTVEITYFDTEKRPVRTTGGYFKLLRRYDAYGRVVDESIFGSDNLPVLSENGTHRVVNEYDDRGRLREKRYLGRRGEPVRLNGRWQHRTRYTYDDRGNTVEIAHFDLAGKPALGPDRDDKEMCSRWSAAYGVDGKLLASWCDKETALNAVNAASKQAQ